MRLRSAEPLPGRRRDPTGTPSAWSARAVTQPSPPLLPGPAAISTPWRSSVTVAVGDDGGDRAAGGLHERGERDAGRLGLAVPRGGLLRGEDGNHGVNGKR